MTERVRPCASDAYRRDRDLILTAVRAAVRQRGLQAKDIWKRWPTLRAGEFDRIMNGTDDENISIRRAYLMAEAVPGLKVRVVVEGVPLDKDGTPINGEPNWMLREMAA